MAWLAKEKEYQSKISVINGERNDLMNLIDKLQKGIKEQAGDKKEDSLQIEALRKELYTLGAAKDMLSKELETMRL